MPRRIEGTRPRGVATFAVGGAAVLSLGLGSFLPVPGVAGAETAATASSTTASAASASSASASSATASSATASQLPCVDTTARQGPLDLGVTTVAGAQDWYRPWTTTSLSQVHRFERDAGKHACLVMWFADWAHTQFDPSQLQEVASRGSVPEITWEPWDAGAPANQPNYTLAKIIAGDFDPYIRSWAKGIAAYGRPVLLRFAQEMDAPLYSWGWGINGNTPQQYVKAWHHVWRIFQRRGATNVLWVWNPLTLTHAAEFYPGDQYVNILGFSTFNGGQPWYSFRQLMQGPLNVAQSIAPTKAVQVSEVGCTEQGGNKAKWITGMFSYLKQHPQVRSLVWFNLKKNGTDWRIESSTAATQAFRQAVASRHYR